MPVGCLALAEGMESEPAAKSSSVPLTLPFSGGDLRRRYQIEDLLYHALKDNGFLIYYQPLFNVRDGDFTEAEALLRLPDAAGGFVPPDEFIPIAEQSGLITEIGCTVLEKVSKFIQLMLRRNMDVDSISVNLSVVQLVQDNIVTRLMDIIRGSGISPNRILLEVTESTVVSNYKLVGDKIQQLSSEGVQFALDDFGTGYSNLSHIISLPFDCVKIDKSLIWDAVESHRCNIMIRELIQIFKNIDLSVTAEGVESAEQDNFSRECGCDKIQGFRYARPMPISQVQDYFGRHVG